MKQSDCLFCSLIEEGSLNVIDKNKHCIAFLDKYPVSKGHVLVSTKQHYEVFHDITDQEILMDLISLLSKVSTRVTDIFGTDYNIHQSNGENAEQSIKHVHFHIIPRTAGDDVKIELPTNKDVDNEEVLTKLRLT